MELPRARKRGPEKKHDCREVINREQGYGNTLLWVRRISTLPKYKMYCYCDVVKKSRDKHVWIYCYSHAGHFQQTPHGHDVKGCWICSPTRRMTTKEFIAKAKLVHGTKYGYAITMYTLAPLPVKILCFTHGEFEQIARNHLMGNGCPTCYLENCVTSFDEFVRRAQLVHGSIYEYLRDGYTDTRGKISVLCSRHGKFTQGAHNHLKGKGCPDCAPNTYSMIAISWLKFREVQLGKSIQHAANGAEHVIRTTNMRADGYVSELKLVLEFHGDFWHGNPNRYPPNGVNSVNGKTFGELYRKTLQKKNYILKLGYKYECIWESDWKRFLKFITRFQRAWRKRRQN